MYSRKPSQSLEWLWTTGAVLATALALAGCVIADFAEGGMGSSNGRVVRNCCLSVITKGNK